MNPIEASIKLEESLKKRQEIMERIFGILDSKPSKGTK